MRVSESPLESIKSSDGERKRARERNIERGRHPSKP